LVFEGKEEEGERNCEAKGFSVEGRDQGKEERRNTKNCKENLLEGKKKFKEDFPSSVSIQK
jgi:hypothetical protein